MFRGSSFHSIDPKGRIIVPARFRDVIKASGADSIMITCMDSCLFAYTHDQWGKLEQRILHLPEKSEAMRRFAGIELGDDRIIAKVRARVEHPFRILKRQFCHVKTRYRGLAKNRAHLFTLFALGNLFMTRRKLAA